MLFFADGLIALAIYPLSLTRRPTSWQLPAQ
jgi:hypothetical protein